MKAIGMDLELLVEKRLEVERKVKEMAVEKEIYLLLLGQQKIQAMLILFIIHQQLAQEI
jgi:hypothetical protein